MPQVAASAGDRDGDLDSADEHGGGDPAARRVRAGARPRASPSAAELPAHGRPAGRGRPRGPRRRGRRAARRRARGRSAISATPTAPTTRPTRGERTAARDPGPGVDRLRPLPRRRADAALHGTDVGRAEHVEARRRRLACDADRGHRRRLARRAALPRPHRVARAQPRRLRLGARRRRPLRLARRAPARRSRARPRSATTPPTSPTRCARSRSRRSTPAPATRARRSAKRDPQDELDRRCSLAHVPFAEPPANVAAARAAVPRARRPPSLDLLRSRCSWRFVWTLGDQRHRRRHLRPAAQPPQPRSRCWSSSCSLFAIVGLLRRSAAEINGTLAEARDRGLLARVRARPRDLELDDPPHVRRHPREGRACPAPDAGADRQLRRRRRRR